MIRETVTAVSLANDPFPPTVVHVIEKPLKKKRTAMKKKAGKKKPGC